MLLAIDTSTRTVGVALYNEQQVYSELVWTSQDYHTVELAPAVAESLKRAGVKVDELSAVAVATGPGSFTGLRIGLALAKGLAFTQNLAMIGVPSLDILAYAQPAKPVQMAAVLRAGRGRLAVGWYTLEEESWKATGTIEVLTAEALSAKLTRPTYICGEMTEEERRILGRKWKNVTLASAAYCLRRPSFLAELGWQRWKAGQVDNPATLSPYYLHHHEPIPG